MRKIKINWGIRIKSVKFWAAIIPAVLYLASIVARWFGIDINIDMIQEEVMTFIKALFGVLVILGIVSDPTTEGLEDSDRAMGYR